MSTSHNGTATVESLSEVFRCFICMEKLRDARLCPHCSKLCCYPCIRRWLSDQHQHCPHCRNTLHLHDLVNCRWAEEVTTQLDNLKTNEINQQKHNDKDKCELHQEKLTVYCSSCSKCICHQCALFKDSHAGHHFLPLDDVYKTNMSIINEHLNQLKRRHVEFICLIQDIERNVEKIKTAKDERFREIRNTMLTMQTKLEEQFQIKFNTLNAQHIHLTRETELIEHTLHDIEQRISTNGKSEVISKQKDLLNSLKIISRKPMISFVTTPISSDFPNEMIPQYNSSTFIIKNFSILQQNVDPIYSQPLHINGLTWRLKVYPDGNGTVRGIYLSVFLELINGLNEPSKYEYRIEMIHQLNKDLSKNIIREFASDFEVGECWGYNKFYLLNALRTEGFIDTINDTLILRFQVRPPTYQQKSRDQQWYIKHLENDKQQLNNEIKVLREKINSTMTGLDNRAETAIDGEDDEYTSLESDQIDSDDEDEKDIHSAAVNSDLVGPDLEVQCAFNSESMPFNETLSLITDEDFILADILERSANDEENASIHLDNQTNISSLFRPITPNEPANNSDEFYTYHPPEYQTTLNNLILLNSQMYQTRTDPPTKSEENNIQKK